MKKNIGKYILLPLALAGCCITASGQGNAGAGRSGMAASYSDAVAPLTLSLEDCRQMALENNAYSRNAELDVRAAWLQKQEALAEYFPRVSANVLGYWALNPLLEIGVTDVLGDNDYAWNIQSEIESLGSMYGISSRYTAFKRGYAASLTAMQPVYAGGRIVAGNRLAKVGMEAAELNRSIRSRKTVDEVEDLWWQIVSLEDKLRTLDHLDGMLDTLYSNLNSAIASGLAAETDILQLDLKRNELAAGRKKVISGIRLQKMNLFNSIGLDYSLFEMAATPEKPFIDSISLTTHSEPPLEPEHYWRDEEDVVSQMDETRLLDLQVKAKKLEKRMAVGEALPQVAIGAMTGYSNLYDKGRYNTVAFATVQIPLSDWGKTARKTQRLDTQVQKAENERDFLRRQLHLQMGKLWLDLTSAYDQWQLAEEALGKSRRLYDAALSNYRAGLIPVQDLLQAETQLRTDSSECTDALIAYRSAVRAYTGRCK